MVNITFWHFTHCHYWLFLKDSLYIFKGFVLDLTYIHDEILFFYTVLFTLNTQDVKVQFAKAFADSCVLCVKRTVRLHVQDRWVYIVRLDF